MIIPDIKSSPLLRSVLRNKQNNMSIHHRKPNYDCPRCTSLFLPYKKGIQCPNCGMAVEDEDTKEYLDVVDLIAGSMVIHKSQYGMYSPGAWYTGSMMDHIQGITYRIFDSMEHYAKPGEEKQYLVDLLEKKFTWDGQEYLEAHIREIALEVFEIYKAKNFSEIKRPEPEIAENEDKLPKFIVSKMRRSAKWERIKKWFKLS